ncbi:MAG TPA: hypothetical protein VFA71_02550 [Terriglobales bacterium]|nr:hypothetical protein [Terriglobales bacterium]
MLEFRLLYSGRLSGASTTNPDVDLKHKMRKDFHPQLRRLWMSKSPLVERYNSITRFQVAGGGWQNASGIDALANEWKRFGYRFIPIVTEERALRCSLDILFLRPETPGFLFQSGDLDVRLKTVLEALRMPHNIAEAGGVAPGTDEDPFYVLMQDAELMSELKVTTDELFLLPRHATLDVNDVFMVIHVKVHPIRKIEKNLGF